jgi:hypothetical protein
MEDTMSDQIDQAADLTRIEALLVDMNKSLVAQAEATADADTDIDNSVEVIAKGADAIVAQNKEAVESLSKGIEGILERLDSLDALLGTKLGELNAKLEKGLKDLGEVPAAPKAVVVAEAEAAPADAQSVTTEAPITKGYVMAKCIAELKAGAFGDRKASLMKSIAQLDSNLDPVAIATDLNL